MADQQRGRPSQDRSADDRNSAPEEAARAFIAVWCRSADSIAGHLPPTQLQALELVAADPGISLRALADELGSIPSSASRLCDRLESAGLLSRSAHASDRRIVALALTRQGEHLITDLARQRRQDLAAVFDRMAPTDRSRLLDGLSAFASAERSRTAESSHGT